MRIILYRDTLGKFISLFGIKYNKLAIDLPDHNDHIMLGDCVYKPDTLLTVKDNAVSTMSYFDIKSNIAVFYIRRDDGFLFRLVQDIIGKKFELTPIQFLDKMFIEGYNFLFHELQSIDVTKIYEYLNSLGNFVQLSYEGPLKDYVRKEKISN